MPVRGLIRTRFWFGLKIGAINVKRFIAAVLLSEKEGEKVVQVA
jgi:hypothetical protein